MRRPGQLRRSVCGRLGAGASRWPSRSETLELARAGHARRVTPPLGHALQRPGGPAVLVRVVGPSSARVLNNGVVYSDEHHSVAISGNVILSYSTQPPNSRYLAAWDHATSRLAARVDGSLAVITIINGGTPPPSEASRKSIRDTIARHAKQIGALAYVVEGRGFHAAAIRSVLSLISLTARYPFPQKVFASVDEAAEWVSRKNGRNAAASAIVSTAGAMRSDGAPMAAAG